MPIYYVKTDSDNQFPDKETLATVVGLPDGITADDYKAITGDDYVAPTTEATTTSTTN